MAEQTALTKKLQEALDIKAEQADLAKKAEIEKLARERVARQDALKTTTLQSLKNGVLFRIDHNAPPDANTEEELRAQQAKLATYIKRAKDDGIGSKGMPTVIRAKMGWFDNRTGKPINPKGLEWTYEVADGISREGPINAQGKIDGVGVIMWASGMIEEGYFENDMM